MIYAYVRNPGKNELQQVENEKERADLLKYAQMSGRTIDKWCAGKSVTAVLRKMKPGDVLLISEVCNLGNSLQNIQKLINECVNRHWKIIVTRDGYVFDDGLSSRLLAASMETTIKILADIKSQNMRRRLNELRCEGRRLGRPPGRGNKELKLGAK